MGQSPTLWERICFTESNPFARFEDGLQVPLDAVVTTPSGSGILPTLEGAGVLHADPHGSPAWAYSAQRVLESRQARPGLRLAGSDPHVTGLGAYGMAATFHTPAVLHAAWRERRDGVGVPRRTLVQVNGPLARHTGPIDVALQLVREAGPLGFAGAVLEFRGPGLRDLCVPSRADLCSTARLTGCLAALTPIDLDLLNAYAQLPTPVQVPIADLAQYASAPESDFDELVVVNGDQLEALVSAPRRGVVSSVESVAGRGVQRVLIGGCVAGDWEALRTLVSLLEGERVDARVDLSVVPASESLERRVRDEGLAARLEATGAQLRRPHELSIAPDAATLATNSCLAAGGLVADLRTCVASAITGRLTDPQEVLG